MSSWGIVVTKWYWKIPVVFSNTAAPSKFCECIAVFFESLFYCFGFCVYLPEKIQKSVCGLFVCLFAWTDGAVSLRKLISTTLRVDKTGFLNEQNKYFKVHCNTVKRSFYSFLRSQIQMILIWPGSASKKTWIYCRLLIKKYVQVFGTHPGQSITCSTT